jgi:tetratricopeptide (TPR) repeat protein
MSEQYDVLCEAAKQALASGDPAGARGFYLRAVHLQNDSASAHYGLGTACYLLHDWAQAAQHFETVARLQPERASTFVNLAAIYKRLDRLDDAIAAIKRGIQLDPKRAEAYHNLAAIYRRVGKIDLAIAAYLEALRLDARMYDAHYYLGTIYQERADPQAAVQHFRAALDLRPDWERAAQALEAAETQLHAANTSLAPAPLLVAPPPQPAAVPFDPERLINPDTQSGALQAAHHAVIELQERSQAFLEVLRGQVEPIIQDLSKRLLDRRTTARDLEKCVNDMEAAFEKMREGEKAMQQGLDRVHGAGEKLLTS